MTAEIERKLNIDRWSVSCINDQDLRSLLKRKLQKLTYSNIEKRMVSSRKLLPKYTHKTLRTTFFSGKKTFKVKQLYNSYNDVIYVPKKMGKLEMLEERLFCKTEAHFKQIIVSVAISKAGKTSHFFAELNTKVNTKYYFNVLLTPEMNRLAKYNEYLFKMELELKQPRSSLKCWKTKNNFDNWSPITDHRIVRIWIK